MSLDKERIFISGGNGVIGNILVDKLHRRGARLFVGDLKPRPGHWPGEISYRQGDLNYITREELDDFGPTVFFHLAATFERSTETYEFWSDNYHHNVHLSNYLMSLLKDMPSLRKVVFASSYLIYDPRLYSFSAPPGEAYRLKENDPIYPRNLTGAAKLSHEIELRFLQEFKQDIQFVSARIFRGYGLNSRDVISRWVRQLLQGETLTVFAKEGMFDYIFADDTAAGLIRLAESEQARGIVNLGTGNARRVSEVLDILRKHFPDMRTAEVVSSIPYEGSQANMDAFRGLTGWVPSLQLEDTIPRIIEHERRKTSRSPEVPAMNVMVTSISRKVPLLKTVARSCRKLSPAIRLFGGDSDAGCIGRYFVDHFWHMPRIADLPQEEFLSFCLQHNIRCIIPCRDGELSYFARMKEVLRQHDIAVMVSDASTVSLCLDKLSFYREFCQLRIPVIPTAERIEELENVAGFVVKERYGAGSLNVGKNLPREQALLFARKLQHPIYQPFIDGVEASVDVYVAGTGKVKGVVARKRNLVIHGESQITTTFRDRGLEQVCVRFAESKPFSGHLVLQVIIDAEGRYHLIECNSRFGGASTLSVAAGLDSFYWFLLESMGNDISEYPFVRPQTEKMQIRFPEDTVVNG
jgi:carbamoyl-phosphate synthase large subunit